MLSISHATILSSYRKPLASPQELVTFSTCYAACQAGNLEEVEAFLLQDPSLIFRLDDEGQSLLYACTISNKMTILQLFYDENPAIINQVRSDGQTLMHIAAEKGYLEIVQWLDEKNPLFIDKCDNNQLTPLHKAAFNEQIAILNFFKKKTVENISLIQQVAQKNCPKTLAFILEEGIDPNTLSSLKKNILSRTRARTLASSLEQEVYSNLLISFKQTLLHLAVEAGQEMNVICLLNHGARVNVRDPSMRTPLILAVIHNKRVIANRLIRAQADIAVLNEENETLLHIAAAYGHKELLVDLLCLPICKALINVQDQEGKTPLHKSVWRGQKSDIVRLLLYFGADPHAKDHAGNTPLHLAAQNGHFKSADILLSKNDLLGSMNNENFLPFDLAIQFGQDNFIHFFLGTKTRLQIGKPSKDIEGFYFNGLLQAKKENLVEEQILFLQKLSALYIQKENFLVAAKILNCALALLDKKKHVFETYLLIKLEEIERLYLKKLGVNASIKINSTIEKRARLVNIRKAAAESSGLAKPIQGVLRKMTQEFKQLLSDLINETQDLLGPPPVKWACLGMGSMSRGEMCPFSDIEFAFVIEKDSVRALEYFRTLSKILEIKVINLGETQFPIFGGGHESPTPDGFCLDSAGNTPLGVTGVYELIGTPNQLAQFQSVKWMERNIILPNAMSNVCLVAGSEELETSYNEQKKKVQQLKEKKEGMQKKNNEELAMRLLGGHLIEFSPDLSHEKEKETAFGVKKELYRPFQEILGCLSLLYDLKEKSTFGRIDELAQLNVFSLKGAENLKKAVNQVLSLRLQVHLFYKDEKEFLCHPEQGKLEDPSLYYFNEQNLNDLLDIYKVLLPFHIAASEFYRTQNKEVLNKSIYFDDSPSIQGEAFEKTLQFSKSQEAYQKAVSLNPNNIEALLKLAMSEKTIGKSNEALPRSLKALKLAQQVYGESHLCVAESHNNIGQVYDCLGEYDNTFKHFQKALEIRQNLLSENHPEVAESYNNIGTVCDSLGNYDKAIDYYQRALEIRLQILGKKHLKVGVSYNNIGILYSNLGDYNKALKYSKKDLKISLQALGENHPDVAISYINMGSLYSRLGKFDKALELLQKALRIFLHILDKYHPDVATVHDHIGVVYCTIGNYAKALEHHLEASNIKLQVLDKNHHDVGVSYNCLAKVYENQGDYDKGLEYYQKALSIQLKILGEGHPRVATIYNNIGMVHEKLGNYENSLMYTQKALKIQLQVLDENHPNIAISYKNLGKVHASLKDYHKALEYLKMTLKIQLQAFNENHPNMASSYNDIGFVNCNLGNYESALEYHQKALRIQLQAYSETHPDVFLSYSGIGLVYCNLGDYDLALEYHQKALNNGGTVLGENHPDIKHLQAQF